MSKKLRDGVPTLRQPKSRLADVASPPLGILIAAIGNSLASRKAWPAKCRAIRVSHENPAIVLEVKGGGSAALSLRMTSTPSTES